MRLFAAFFITLVVLGATYVLWAYYPKSPEQNNANEDSKKVSHSMPQVGTLSDFGVMVFTGILTVATVIQIVLWVKSNETGVAALTAAKEANEETKRSVDAYINAERPMITCESMRLVSTPCPKGADSTTKWSVEWNFGNAGKSAAVITSRRSRLFFLGKDDPFPDITEIADANTIYCAEPVSPEVRPNFSFDVTKEGTTSQFCSVSDQNRVAFIGEVIYVGMGGLRWRNRFMCWTDDMPYRAGGAYESGLLAVDNAINWTDEAEVIKVVNGKEMVTWVPVNTIRR
ncbi:MAG: hypothetical protein WAU70_04885 [Flavobacteriales bacterium]